MLKKIAEFLTLKWLLGPLLRSEAADSQATHRRGSPSRLSFTGAPAQQDRRGLRAFTRPRLNPTFRSLRRLDQLASLPMGC